MPSPNSRSELCSNKYMQVEDTPPKADSRPLPLGSVWVQPEMDCTPPVAGPSRCLFLGPLKKHQTQDLSKSVEIIAAKGEHTRSPSRRITRSITILSDSKQRGIRHSDGKGATSKDEVQMKNHSLMESGKRRIERSPIDPSQKKKKTMPPILTQESVLCIHPDNRFGANINVFNKYNIISKLQSKRTESQKALFQRTCFGHFLRMSEIRFQHQTIHKMLLMEVMQSADDEMWFKVAGQHLRFSINEFCLIIGLKCYEEGKLNMLVAGRCRLKEIYFRNQMSVQKDVEDMFEKLPKNTSDEDVDKMGILYLITSFLFTNTQPKSLVPDPLMRLVDSPVRDTFLWGKELFQNTYASLKLAFEKPKPNGGDTKGPISYR